MLKTYLDETSEKKFQIGEEYLIKVNSDEQQKETFEERFKKIELVLEKEFKILFQYFSRTNKSKILEIYKEDIKILIPKKTNEKQYKDEDFQDYFVTDEDFEFCKDLNENNDWSLASTFSTNVNSYISKSKSVRILF
jgi:hypothetical protein